MTVSDESTAPAQRPPTPRISPEAVAIPKRGPLQTVRDVLACIFFLLASIIMIALLVFGGAAIKGLSDLSNDLNSPDVSSTECVGEVPC